MRVNFAISSNLDKNKVFIVNRSEIEGRLDPLFYSNNIFGFLKEIKFDIKTIREISQYTIAGFGVGKEGQNLDKEGYIQIRPTNVDEYGLLKFDKNIYLDEEYLTKKSENIIQKYDVLFNNTNSQELVGKTSYFDLDQTCFHSNHITRIKVNEDLILPKYLWRLLNFYQKRKIFYSICTNWNNQSGVGIELLNSLKIPVPPKATQEKIVQIMDNAYLLKKQNEAEAEKLLASIDDYLLDELGIKLSPQPENSLKNRIFYTSLKEISGGRFDSNYYKNNHKENYTSLGKAKFQTIFLKDITTVIFQGSGCNIDESSKYILLKVKNIKKSCNIDYDDIEKIGDFPKSKLLKQGDIITPCIGEAVRQIKFAVFENEDDKYLVDNNTGVIRLNSKADSNFVNYCLCSSIGRLQINRLIGGGGVPFLGADNLKKLLLPLPPIPKQQEIANHITQIRNQAQLLKEKANIAIKQANQEIEQILLGN